MKVFDLHCDTIYKLTKGEFNIKENNGHITEEALLKGNYLAQCFAIYIPRDVLGEDSFSYFQKQYDFYKNILSASSVLDSAKTIEDIENNCKSNKVSAVLTVENAELLNRKLERLKYLEDCGVKILGLIHNGENCIGFPHSADKKSDNLPLKNFGREVVDAVNSTNMLIDVSHLNYAGFYEVAALCKKPFIATHSACRNLQDNSRNLYDDQIEKLAQSGGIIGVPFYSHFLNGSTKTEISDIIRHIEHIIKVGGDETVAFGTDFDGMECEMFLNSCAEMPILAEAIIQKFGFSVAEKICYKNALRVLK